MYENKKLKRKVRNSYIISTVSISLVLFLLGSVGYLILSALGATDRMKESIAVYVMLKDGTDENARQAVGEKLKGMEGVRDVLFVSKDDAVKEFKEFSGNDPQEFLDFNPLPDSYEVHFSAYGADDESLPEFEATVAGWDEVSEVVYQRNVIEQIGANINKFNLILLLFGVALLFISLILLNNTIRVSIYSKRYIISTMKLVGATKGFIMKPFLGSAVLQGVYAAVIAILMFGALVWGLHEGLPEIRFGANNMELIYISAGMLVLGVLISLLFTAFAVNKFVKMRTNKIHMY